MSILADSAPVEKEKLSKADELSIAGSWHHREGRIDAARLHYIAALMHNPVHDEALQNLSAALIHMEKYAAAQSVARRAFAANPKNFYAKSNIAAATIGLQQFRDAEQICADLVREMPNATTWSNYGLSLYMVGKLSQALGAFDISLSLKSDVPEVEHDRALTLLGLGNLTEGLPAYDATRWARLGKPQVASILPEWQGEPIKGKRLLVHHEQGFGDSLMNCRWISDLVDEGAIITFVVPRPLVRLFRISLGKLATIESIEDDRFNKENFDYYSPLGSVWRWLGVTDIAECFHAPYLRAPRYNGPKLPKGIKVGLCWASGVWGPRMRLRRRVIPLQMFLPMTEIPHVKVISLQKGQHEAELAEVGTEGIVFDIMAGVEDFADTAAAINELDLVVSVDSAVAHLAGALGKPVVMLGPYTRCWRWWKDTSGWPWYNDMTIVKQDEDGTWDRAVKFATDYVETLSRGT